MRRQPPTNWWATLALLLSMTSGCAPPERPDTEPRPDTATPAESSAAIRLVLKTSGWPRTSVVIPELRAGPHLTAVSSSGGAWAAARAVSLNHPLGWAETIDPDTTVRLGHHRGTLFIRFEIYVEATDKSGVGPGGGAFDGTGGEILLASAERPDDVKHFVFNLHDAKLEQEVIHVPHAGDYNADPSWGCPWEVAVRRLAERALIQIAIPIAPALGFEPGRGDTFRLGLVRRRPCAAHPVVSWSAIRGPLTTNSPDFGLAAVGGNHAERFDISDLSTRGRRGVMALAGDRPRVGLRGDALPVVVDHLMAQVLSVPDTARPVRARLLVAKRREVARLETPVPAWPATFLLTPPDGRAGDYTFELETGDEPPLRLAAPVSWRPSVLA